MAAQEFHLPYQLVLPLTGKAQPAFLAAIKAMILTRQLAVMLTK